MTLKKTVAYIFIVLLVAIIGVASVVFVKGFLERICPQFYWR